MFSRILIANRGEIALRIIRACHEMGIEAVAVYSDADRNAMHVRHADQAMYIGPAPSTSSYLNQPRIIEAAIAAKCEAIHPGYGFLSENAEFAEKVDSSGLVFIGPPASAIRLMGLKTEALTLMRQAGVPTVPGYQDAGTDDAYLQAAARIGYPVLVKAAAGGGGKGMRVVRAESDLIEALGAARREAANAFGDDRVFLEKYLEGSRHVEFQVLADQHGNIVHLFERECSIQRRHQKIIEESPSPLLTPDIRAQMGAAAVEAARAAGYMNAGTVEFIMDADRHFYFLEMNTRLQVEHPVTEWITGLDLVRLQIQIAAGQPLPFTQEALRQRGHAIECRVYAEDPANGFLPSIGTILKAVEPAGPGVRVDAGVSTGDEVSIHYDPMIAKLSVFAADRAAALARMRQALADYVIFGLTTNLEFLRAVIDHPVFVSGQATTNFIPEHMANWTPITVTIPDEALILAALAEMLEKSMGKPTAGNAVDDGDAYDPWARLDGFRMGSSK